MTVFFRADWLSDQLSDDDLVQLCKRQWSRWLQLGPVSISYGTGQDENDERTGRSFGESFSRLALDASDKHYLETLEDYVRTDGDNARYFYLSLLEILPKSCKNLKISEGFQEDELNVAPNSLLKNILGTFS